MSALFRKIRGNTVLEVVVALIIISASIALTGTLFSSVFNSSSRIIKQQVWYDVNNQINLIKHSGKAEVLEIDKGIYVLISEVDVWDESKGLVNIKVYGTDTKGKLLVKRRFFLEAENIE